MGEAKTALARFGELVSPNGWILFKHPERQGSGMKEGYDYLDTIPADAPEQLAELHDLLDDVDNCCMTCSACEYRTGSPMTEGLCPVEQIKVFNGMREQEKE